MTAPVAEVATPSPPVVTRSTIKAALAKADKAFDSFQGRDSIGILKTIGGLAAGAADYVASAILTPNSTPDTSPGTTDHGYITGGKGDPHALEGRLRTALGQLPFGKTRGQPIINEVFGVGGLTTRDANIFRGRFKSAVNQEIAEEVKTGVLVVRSTDVPHPVGHGRALSGRGLPG